MSLNISQSLYTINPIKFLYQTRQMPNFDLTPIDSLRTHVISLNSITSATIGQQKKLNNTTFTKSKLYCPVTLSCD